MTRRRLLLVFLCLASAGCSSVRPVAQRGVDLLENSERSYVVRSAAVAGSLVGVIVAMPFAALLFPSYAFDGAWGWGVREPTEAEGPSAEGDYAIPLAGVPIEYGIGLGARVFAAPFAWVEDSIYGEPGASEGWVDEVQEEPPGIESEADPDAQVSELPREESEAAREPS